VIKKLLLALLLFIIACLLAGLYGVVHNQVSFTVAPEYFTKFKFYQFGVHDLQASTSRPISSRGLASGIGWAASWWMGLVIGVVLIPLGLVIPGPARYFWSMVRVFGLVILTTLVVGLLALLVAFVIVDPETVTEIERYGNQITDDAAFVRAGTMHNFSYLGGVIGIITGIIAIFRYRNKARAAVHD